VAATAPLAALRRSPAAALAIMLAAQAGILLSGRLSWTPVLVLVWLLTLALCPLLLPRAAAVGALAAMELVIVVAVFLPGTRNPVPWDATAAEAAIAIVAWGVGENVRARRRARAEQQAAASRLRALRDRDAASRERVELARELHDVVAHHVSLIAVKAATASYVTGSLPPAAVTAFDEIADQARTALTELRTVLGALREPGTPAAGTPLPGLDGLAELVESQQGHGTDVTLELAVRGPAPPGFVQVCVYRIVQEALTNARRHAPGSRVRVGVRVADGDLRVTVRDDGGRPGAGLGPGPARPEEHGRAAPEPDGGALAEPPEGGFGLRGIAERVAALGGRAQAGALPGGGFEVAAVIPLPGPAT
jgi:signal transduction histidine kinase